MERYQLKQMQALPLEIKIQKTNLRIKEWYEHYDGDVYVSFSGGKDSTVLLHLVRKLYPDVVAVFSDTGLEFPEIREFVKNIENVEWLKPAKNFKDVINEYGYPIISKEVADCIYGARKGQPYRTKRIDGSMKGSRYDASKYAYLMDAPFKIAQNCCYYMKKKPFKDYEKKSGKKPIVGTMACESQLRTSSYLKSGCNAFNSKRPMSKPISFWTEKDIWGYMKKFNVNYSKIYDMGYQRTGCVFCGFGCHLEKEPNRFQLLKKTHPKLFDYCMGETGLGMKKVLDFIGVDNS